MKEKLETLVENGQRPNFHIGYSGIQSLDHGGKRQTEAFFFTPKSCSVHILTLHLPNSTIHF